MPDQKQPISRITEFQSALTNCWSIETSSLWTSDNPAAGQCGVTALVANDMFGGDILKTPHDGTWHFYNVIEGRRYDFTESQFAVLPEYQNMDSNREEAFGDTNASQYGQLGQSVSKAMGLHSGKNRP